MAASTGLALPEPLLDGNARSWFKRFEICAAANEWGDMTKLHRVPTLLRGRAWAVYDALSDEQTESFENVKKPF